MEEGDLELIKNHTVDLLGINYYQPRRVKAKEHLPHPDAPFMPERFLTIMKCPDEK